MSYRLSNRDVPDRYIATGTCLKWARYVCILYQCITRDALDMDFHYLARTGIYQTPDIDPRTVRHIDNIIGLSSLHRLSEHSVVQGQY